MSKTKKCVIFFLVAVAALCMAIALGAGCKGSKSYEVKFVTGDHAAVSSIKAEDGEIITLPTPEEEDGFVFKGWYLAEDYSGNQYSASANFTVTEDTIFYGKYNALAPITLNLDGGTLTQSSFSLEEGENVSSYMNELVPEKPRHQFDYWADANGEPISSTLTMPAEGLTLTAVYKVEVSVEVWVWNSDYNYAVHYPEYDMIDYASVGTTNFELQFPTVPTGLSMSSNQGSDGTYILAKVDSDPDKNAVRIYYDARTLQWSCDTNYPEETGLASTVCASGSVIFGETVTLPADLSCYGYLFIGWSTYPGATTPEYAVDVLSPNLMVWDEQEEAYVLSGEGVVPATYRPEESVSTLFAVWTRGYFDMFGSYDVVYDLDDGGNTVYLSRGGVFWESQAYNSTSNSYTFVNEYDGEKIYEVRLRSDGYFVFYDRSRSLETRYLVEYSYSGNGGAMMLSISSTEYFYYTAYDTVEYIVNGYSMGVAEYGYNKDGDVVLTFTSGEMAGEVYNISLVILTMGDGSTRDGYIIRDESEAGMKITFGGVGYTDGYGGFEGYMDGDSYYIELGGYGLCTYCSGGTLYSYRYWLEGDVLTLFSTTYSYGYSYVAEYHYVEKLGRWVYYYSALDGTFSLYDEAGTQIIGEVTLDGLYSGTMTLTNGTQKRVLFSLSSYVIGSVVTLYSDPDSAGIYYETNELYLYSYDAAEGYFLQKLPDTYIESYYFVSMSSGLSSYQVFTIRATDDTTGTITLYLYGYSYYVGYVYFSVWTGDYEIKTNETYGFSYYLVTDITPTEEADYYGITAYYSSIPYEDLIAMTEVAFIPVTFTSTSGSYTYYYNSNIWYYVVSAVGSGDDADESAEKDTETETENRYTEYEGEFKVNILDEYGEEKADLEGEVSMIVVGDYLVYAVMTYEGVGALQQTVYFDGYVYGVSDYKDKEYETFTIYTLMLGFEYDGLRYYWTPVVRFELGEGENTFELVTGVPYYIFSYVIASGDNETGSGLNEDEYFTYDLWDADVVTYVKGETIYTGTIEEYTDGYGNTTTSTGHTLYVFTGSTEEDPQSLIKVTFIVMSYGTADEGYFPIFVIYDENSRLKYTGADGSVFETDGVGLETEGLAGATFTIDGTTYSVSAYIIVDTEDAMAEYGTGHYGNGYIEIYADGTYYVLDLVGEEEEEKSYDYTTRGQEYWYTCFVIDNQIMREYVMTLDGYDAMDVCFYDEDADEYVVSGTGVYEIVDTVITFSWSYSGEGDGGTTYEAEGEIDFYSGYYAYIFINHSEFESHLVSSLDFSVLVLDGYGDAIRYLTNGYYEYGFYTILDDTYLYYVNYAGDDAGIFKYDFEKSTIFPVEYSADNWVYYSADMTASMYLSTTGTVTFDSSNYYYYVKSGSYIYIYYLSDGEDDGYGYSKSGAILLGDTVTLDGTMYRKIDLNETLEFKRAESDVSKYGYLTYSSNIETGETTENKYTLGNLRFTVKGAEFVSEDTNNLTLTYTDGTTVTRTAYVYREYVNTEGEYKIYITVSSPIYSYGDFFMYDITVDLDAMTYEITSMYLYMLTYSYDYMYLSYMADVCYSYYDMFYVYWMFGYGDAYYYLALECYDYFYYYYYMSVYYYSYMYLIWEYDEECTETGDMYATGYFMPYLLCDLDGYTFYFYMEDVELTSSGYRIEFEGYDGNTYALTFYPYSDFLSYYGYYGFDVIAFEGFETDTTEKGEGQDYYEVKTGFVIFSDYYDTDTVFSIGLTKYTYDSENGEYGEGEIVSGLGIITVNGNLYFIHVEYGDDGAFEADILYKIVYTYDETGAAVVEVSEFGGLTSYTTETGHLDLFTENGDSSIILVCIETYEGEDEEKELVSRLYYYVYGCEYSDGVYSVVLSNGSEYTIELDETNKTASMELVEKEEEQEDEDEDGNDGDGGGDEYGETPGDAEGTAIVYAA